MDAHRQDFEAKIALLRKWLVERRLDGVLLTSGVNFAWLTHGRSFVSVANEGSVARVLVTDRRVALFTTTNEAPRLEREEVAGWGLDLVAWPWYERFEDAWSRDPASGLRVALDRDVESELSPLRQMLSPHERQLLARLGADSAELLERFCLDLTPGRRENELAGELARDAWAAGMEPLVLNMATDERAFLFRHAIPTAKALRTYGVFSVCFRRHGLHVTLTRSVHFGAVPAELADKHRVACELEAAAQRASVAGAPVGLLVDAMLENYGRLGWPEEWKQHPIGGCLGFQPREFDAVPGDRSVLSEGQGFCWNPTIAGAKSEETFLVTAEGPVAVTAGSRFPLVTGTHAGLPWSRPAILTR